VSFINKLKLHVYNIEGYRCYSSFQFTCIAQIVFLNICIFSFTLEIFVLPNVYNSICIFILWFTSVFNSKIGLSPSKKCS